MTKRNNSVNFQTSEDGKFSAGDLESMAGPGDWCEVQLTVNHMEEDDQDLPFSLGQWMIFKIG